MRADSPSASGPSSRTSWAAEELRFEEAALLRDELTELRSLLVRDPVDGSAVLAGSTADVDATVGL